MPFDGSKFEGKTVAQKMLELFNGGRKWRRGAYYSQGRYCLMGAFAKITGRNCTTLETNIAFESLKDAICAFSPYTPAIPFFNDKVASSFKDIESALLKMHELEMEALMQHTLILN